ncbi:MAG: general secretion pathway protein GspD [Gammaproteobacteria bacterium]|nr:general secretion pathway protein GspD [Gammaproteobacteria bacterium]
MPEPIRGPLEGLEPQTDAAPPEAPARQTTVSATPGVVIQRSIAEGLADQLGEGLTGDPIQVTFNELPLIAFINEVFGELLDMSFAISPPLQAQADLVTLRLTEPVSPTQLFAAARRVLASYGIDMRDEDGVLTFFANDEVAGGEVPLIVSGRTLPEVPPSHRTIFQLVLLKVTSPSYVRSWLLELFDREALEIIEDPDRNTVVLRGNRRIVERALNMVEVFDQPALHGRHGIIIEPAFLKAEALADLLSKVLTVEGYVVSRDTMGGSVIFVVLDDLNKLVVYATDRATLQRTEDYARSFDEEHRESITDALFTYEVRNTQAELLAETLNQVLPATDRGTVRPSTDSDDNEAQPQPAGGGAIVVDKNNNLLLYRGSGAQWAEILEIIAKLDRPVPSVLVDVVIAEVTLGDEQASGFEFVFDGVAGSRSFFGGTLGALGVGAKGGTLTLDSAGQTRAVLNFFAENSLVVIRSNPRLLVKSGATGTIQVGNEIPTISQIAERGTQIEGSTNILQQVSYRNTGVSLEFTPIVQANGLVDLEISQVLSEARPTAATSLDGTPTILTRDITTSLTLRDGAALLMGGLIANSQSDGSTRLPALGSVPVLGRLFRSESYQNDRTELIVMVIPYVVTDYQAGVELTERVKQRLELHEEFRQ